MKIRLGKNRCRGFIVQCIIVILVIVIGVIVIIQLIKICKKYLGPKPPPHDPDHSVQVVYPSEYNSYLPEVRARIEAALAESKKDKCQGFSYRVSANELPTGWTLYMQRSTNLVTWEDIAQVVPDPEGMVAFCDNDAPWPQAFYRLRATNQ